MIIQVAGLLLLYTSTVYSQPLEQKFPVTKLTDRVYIIYAPLGIPSKENAGFRSNVSFVLTSQGVVVIDPGSSVHVGRMVLKHISAITSQPVIAVFNTHIHGDHWLGNQAFLEANPKLAIYGHKNMITQAQQGRGEHWIKLLNKMTDGAITGTRPVPPNHAITHGDTITIGDVGFHVLHSGNAHTDNDIMLHIPQQQVLFCGDLVRNGLIGGENKYYLGSILAINQAMATNSKIYIPGNGKAGGQEIVEQYRRLMVTLYRTVEEYYNKGMEDFEIKSKVIEKLSPYRSWVQFSENIGRLVNQVYLEIESRAFE